VPRLILTVLGYLFGLPLEWLVISALLRGGMYRRFPLALAFMAGQAVTTIVETPLDLAVSVTHARRAYALFVKCYWTDEVLLQVLVFAVVLSLIWSATARLRSRRVLRTGLLIGVVLMTSISFLAHFSDGADLSVWMTSWARDLDFCAAVLDMLLWVMLIGSHPRESCILMLSGGLGIMFAGEAIGESIRSLSSAAHHWAALPGGALMVLSNLTFLYIWWRALPARDSGEV
jgi:hypothetical protein